VPIPSPESDESKDVYVSRCMAAMENEDIPKDQKLAICYDKFRERKKSFDLLNMGGVTLLKKDGGRFIIGGYGNVCMLSEEGKVIPDSQMENVSLDALGPALELMVKRESRRNIMAIHSNIQIGEILLDPVTDSYGKSWKTQIIHKTSVQYPKVGLFIVVEIFNDTPPGQAFIKMMESDGRMLKFSIGGLPLETEKRCDEDKCWTEITKLYLAEVSSCENPVNKESTAFIIKDSEQPNLPLNGSDNYQEVDKVYIGETPKSDMISASGNTDCGCGISDTVDKSNESEADKETEGIDKMPEEEIIKPNTEDSPSETEKTDEVQEESVEPVEKKEEKPEDEEEDEEEEVVKTDEPQRTDYETPDAFFKAYKTWIEFNEKNRPITKGELSQMLSDFEKKILKSVGETEVVEGLTLGEAVKKSFAVKKAGELMPYDFDAIQKAPMQVNMPRMEE